MTSYDRYLGYVRSSPFYYRHCPQQSIQMDLPEVGPHCGVKRGAPVDKGQSTPHPTSTAGDRHVVDGRQRGTVAPAFTIDAILSRTTTTTGSGSTSGSEWSRGPSLSVARPQNATAASLRETATHQLAGGEIHW